MSVAPAYRHAGVNGAGKTTQLQIITGALQPDMGNVVKARANLKIAYLTQEFDVEPSRTVREEFYSAYGAQLAVCGDPVIADAQVLQATCVTDIVCAYLLHSTHRCTAIGEQAHGRDPAGA